MTQNKEQCLFDKFFSSMKILTNHDEFFENKEYSEDSYKIYTLFSLAATYNMHIIYLLIVFPGKNNLSNYSSLIKEISHYV